MQTTPDHILLRSPDALVAALPYLLGFHPAESAVLVWLRRGRITLSQRLDLPRSRAELEAWQDAVFGHAGARQAEEVVLVLVSARVPDEELVQAVVRGADVRGVSVRDTLHLDGGRWRSLMCSDPQCCPSEGRVVPPATGDAVAAEFAVMGRAPAADREEIAASLAADAGAVARVSAASTGAEHEHDLESWRDSRIACVSGLLDADPGRAADPAQIARAVEGLGDVRVRDTILWELAQWPSERIARSLQVLIGILRAAPVGAVAPVATVTAVAAWALGDGVRAAVALERAHDDEPAYSLAVLLSASLRAGLPADAWRESLAGLTREECRWGREASASRTGSVARA